MGNKFTTLPCYNSDDDYYANFDDDYNVNENNDYDNGNNGVNHQTNEKDLTLEEYFRSLPPPTFTEYVDEEFENNSSKNQSSTNNSDEQPEKWDNPFDLNAAELGLGLGGVATDIFGSIANKGRGVPNSEDSTLANALACRNPECIHHIGNAEEAGLISNAQANALRKAAMGKGDDLSSLFNGNTKPNASDLKKYAENQGWTYSRTENGPIKYTDENGVVRITIKQGSSRAPGSAAPHVELRNSSGQRIDPQGNPVTRKSTGNHTPINYDL